MSMEDADADREATSTRPFLVLDFIVRDYRPTVNRRTGDWAQIHCRRNAAHGCGPLGDDIVNGLSLFARLGADGDPDGFPSLRLGATEDVFRRVAAEIPDGVAKAWGRHVRMTSYVVSVSVSVSGGGAMVCSLSFAADNNKSLASYYLVFVSGAGNGKSSLSLLPEHRETAFNCVPMAVRDLSGGDYALALLARRPTGPAQIAPRPVICLASLGISSSSAPWGVTKEFREPDVSADGRSFRLEDAFLFKGKAVWSDLMKGILYCDSSDLLQNQDSFVDLKPVLLPDEYRKPQDLMDLTAYHCYRAIGGVGDSSVWFVCITPSSHHYCLGDETVFKMLSVDILSESEESEEFEVRWKEHREFTLRSVWELEGFKERGLPVCSEPIFPFVRQEDDGVVYFTLADPKRGGGSHVVGGLRLASCRYIANTGIHRPLVVPADFFSPRSETDA